MTTKLMIMSKSSWEKSFIIVGILEKEKEILIYHMFSHEHKIWESRDFMCGFPLP